ncbi:MAG TPA: DNA adenine methylase, partial [Oscillatoriaceae cyanobacterium]
MNYIGSKFSLLGEIRAMLARHGVASGRFCDLFSGTSVVAQMARLAGFQVLANDLQHYSYVMQKAFLEFDGYPDFARLRRMVPAIARCDDGGDRPLFGLGAAPGAEAGPLNQVLAYLEALPPEAGPFYHAYCEGGDAGRNYFAHENGQRLEAMRNTLERWYCDGWLDEGEYHVLLASLIETMDQLANTASVYGAYLKHVKASARQPLRLRMPRLLTGGGPHRAHRLDGNALVRELAATGPVDVLYLDPPYNQRQYHANYHLLETIARWDLADFEPAGKTGLRPGTGSRYCSRRAVKEAFAELLDAAQARHILVSYNNEGLLPESELRALLEAKAAGGLCDFHTLPYRRFRADADGASRRYKGDEVREFLFLIRPTGVPSPR